MVVAVDVDVLDLRVALVGGARPGAVPLVVNSVGQLVELAAGGGGQLVAAYGLGQHSFTNLAVQAVAERR